MYMNFDVLLFEVCKVLFLYNRHMLRKPLWTVDICFVQNLGHEMRHMALYYMYKTVKRMTVSLNKRGEYLPLQRLLPSG